MWEAPAIGHLRAGPVPQPVLVDKLQAVVSVCRQPVQSPRVLLPGPEDLEVNSPYPALQQVIDQPPSLLLTSGDIHMPNLNLLRPSSLLAVGLCLLPSQPYALISAVKVPPPPPQPSHSSLSCGCLLSFWGAKLSFKNHCWIWDCP